MGMESVPIHGPADDENKSRIETNITARREKGAQPFEGENEKTPEQLEIINAVNYVLAKELKTLDLPYSAIPPERVHFLDGKQWHQHIGRASIFDKGVTWAENQAVIIHTDNTHDNVGMFTTLLHESIHYASLEKTKFTSIEHPEDAAIAYRVGYQTIDKKDPNFKTKLAKSDKLLFGFNEAVVDFATFDMAGVYRDELKEKFNIDIPDYDFEDSDRGKKSQYNFYTQTYLGYWSDINHFLIPIIDKMAEHKKIEPREVFEQFFKGQFTGEMMHLRDIEQALGKNGLRVIALYGARQDKFGKEITGSVVDYLQLEDESEREKTGEEILKKYSDFRKSEQKT